MPGLSITDSLDRLIRWADGEIDGGHVLHEPVQPDEELVESKLRTRRGASRPNTIAVMSPKGGVGKTTCAFVLGNVLASHVRQRVVAVDATVELGMLTALVPDELRSERSVVDLLRDAPQIASAAAIRPYVSTLPTGLHVLAAPPNPAVASAMTARHYEGLVRLLSVFYEVVLLDLSSGVHGELAQLAARAADQLVVVTTPESLTADAVVGSLEHLPVERTTVVLNMAQPGTLWDPAPVERRFRERRLVSTTTLPYDEDLLRGLTDRSYTLDALSPEARTAVMRLGVVVANRLH